MEQYTVRFHELYVFAHNIVEDEEDIKAMYVKSMRCNTRHAMQHQACDASSRGIHDDPVVQPGDPSRESRT